MKVILLQDIKGVGKKDEVINASDGYARNFLLPKKMGVEANAENMSKLKAKQDSNQYKKSVEKENQKKQASELEESYNKLVEEYQKQIAQLEAEKRSAQVDMSELFSFAFDYRLNAKRNSVNSGIGNCFKKIFLNRRGITFNRNFSVNAEKIFCAPYEHSNVCSAENRLY